MVSESFNDWDECYEHYLNAMDNIESPYVLAECHWRGVFNSTQADRLVADHMRGKN